MEKTLTWFKLSGATVCVFLTGFLGGWDIFLKTLITLTVLDFITGILSAIYNKKLSSSIGYHGIIKKIGLYIMVGIACLLDQLFNSQMLLRSAMIGFYIAIEGISITENWGKMELPLPKFIKKVLLQLKDKSDEVDMEGYNDTENTSN